LLMQQLQRGKRESGRTHKKNAWLGHGKMSFLFFLEKHIWKKEKCVKDYKLLRRHTGHR